jgi:hypothetical protein
MTTLSEAKNMLDAGKALIREGRTGEARTLIADVIKADPNNGRAWYAYSFVAEGQERQIDALEKTLILRPDSRRAMLRLNLLMSRHDPSFQPTSATLPLPPPVRQRRSKPLAPTRKRSIPRSLLITGVVIAGTFVLLLVLSINTLMDSSKPQPMPTLLPLGMIANNTTAMNTP